MLVKIVLFQMANSDWSRKFLFGRLLGELDQHVRNTHTFPARRGTLAYHKASKKVLQQFQDSLPKVQLCGEEDIRNKYMKKWVGMTFSADGGQIDHVRQRVTWASIEYGRQHTMLRSRRLSMSIKVSGYKGVILIIT